MAETRKKKRKNKKKMKLATKLTIALATTAAIVLTLFVVVINRPSDSSIVQAPSAPEEESSEAPPVTTPIVEKVSVSAAAAYTMGEEKLYSFRPDKRWPIASITKLMTALVAYENFELSESLTITRDMVETEGASGGFSPGERFTIEDLIDAMIIVSSNDAARALAINYGEDEFVAEMNKKAKEIGMTNTSFVDSTGLSVQNLSSADDLYKLAKYIWENQPDILKISRRKTDTIVDIRSGSGRKLDNINVFAGRSDFLGGKTGSIPEADGNLLSVFYVPERKTEIVIVVLGTENRFKETEDILAKVSKL